VKISVSKDGSEFIIRIPRAEFLRLGGFPLNKPLSNRQREILSMIAMGKQNREIAYDLGITVRTVKHHVSALLQIHGVQTRHELLVTYVKIQSQGASDENPQAAVPGLDPLGSRSNPAASQR
jgi:DNA-binding NarL/FixJ family response regulator